jgi:hypothetical protein
VPVPLGTGVEDERPEQFLASLLPQAVPTRESRKKNPNIQPVEVLWASLASASSVSPM